MQRRLWLYSVLLFVAGFAVYGYWLGNGFLFDDELQVVGNPLIHSLDHIANFFRGSTYASGSADVGSGIYFKPFTVLSMALLWQASPSNPLGFHLAQLLLAIVNSVLVLQILRRFMRATTAALAALVFLLHPLNSEVVVYIGDFQDVLFSFFGLGALLWIITRTRWNIGSVGVCALLFLASLLAKETGLLVLCVAVLYTALCERRALRPVLTSAGSALFVYFALRLGVAHLQSLVYQGNQIGRADFATRLLTAPKVIMLYLFKFFIPWKFTTTQDWVVRNLATLDFWIPFAGMLMTIAALLWGARRWGRTFLFFALWLAGALFFHSHVLVPLDGTFSDRWFYFASVAAVGLLGLLWDRQTRTWEWALALLVSVGLGVRSFTRAADWQDGFTLSSREVELLPDSYSLRNNLGTELFRRGKIDEAKVQFEKSIEIAPNWDVNWSNLGAVYQRLGDDKKAEEYYLRAINNGNYLLAYENLCGLMLNQNRLGVARQIIEQRALPRHLNSERLSEIYRYILAHPATTPGGN